MQPQHTFASRVTRRTFGILGVLAVAALLPPSVRAQYWSSYGGNAQHSGVVAGPSQYPQAVKWSTPVDKDPQYAGGGILYTHYGSVAITAKNTVLVPVKLEAGGSFEVNAYVGGTGRRLWTFGTDYVLPSHSWVPPMGITLTPGGAAVAIPGAGGSVWLRSSPDSTTGATERVAFVNLASYLSNEAAFNSAIQISTPITSDASGNLYFGYVSTGAPLPGYPNGIPSGLARISSAGAGSFVAATSLSSDSNIEKVVANCAPALSADGTSIYVAVNSSNDNLGYLCQASSSTLSPMNHVLLVDPRGGNAELSDEGTASPTVGPDGDVYFGVLENGLPSHHARGWLLHFDSMLKTSKIPGSFGWDDSATIVPSKLVPSYTGTSSYLLLTKYNDYANPGIGGSGQNKVAVLDPNATEQDPITPNVQVMAEVLTVLGPTANPSGIGGVCEWCINSAAVDEINKCAIINSEDGHVYRWSFITNELSPGVKLAAPTGEAYTSTAIGPDGAVYAVNNATLCCVVAAPRATPAVRYNSSILVPWQPIGRIATVLIAGAVLALIALASKSLAGHARRPSLSGSWHRRPALIPIERTT